MSPRSSGSGFRRSCSTPAPRPSRSCSRSCCPGTRSRCSRPASSSRATCRALGVVHVRRGARSCSSRSRSLFLVWARSRQQGLPPARRGRRRDHARRRLGGAAARLADVRQARHPGRRRDDGHPVGDVRRAAAAGALIVAGARVRAVHAPEPPNPAADDVGLGRRAARASATAGRSAGRATRPRSPRCCATARRGRASRATLAERTTRSTRRRRPGCLARAHAPVDDRARPRADDRRGATRASAVRGRRRSGRTIARYRGASTVIRVNRFRPPIGR